MTEKIVEVSDADFNIAYEVAMLKESIFDFQHAQKIMSKRCWDDPAHSVSDTKLEEDLKYHIRRKEYLEASVLLMHLYLRQSEQRACDVILDECEIDF